jgi:hypothetical protein
MTAQRLWGTHPELAANFAASDRHDFEGSL